MRFPLLFGAVLLALSSVPVYAQACLSIEALIEAVEPSGVPTRALLPEEIPVFLGLVGVDAPADLTGVVIVDGSNGLVFGLETKGCLGQPLPFVMNFPGAKDLPDVSPAPQRFNSPALKSPKAEVQS